MSKARLADIADVPTAAESGYPAVAATTWTGLFAPAGTDPAIVGKLNGALNAGLKSAELVAALAKVGNVPLGGPPEALATMILVGERALGADREGAQPEGGLSELNLTRTYVGRLANDSQMPPPISATPDRRPSNLARHDVMNQARPSPAATAQAESVQTASTTETAHMTASCRSTGRLGSMNCGRNAVKNAMLFGFETATNSPRRKWT